MGRRQGGTVSQDSSRLANLSQYLPAALSSQAQMHEIGPRCASKAFYLKFLPSQRGGRDTGEGLLGSGFRSALIVEALKAALSGQWSPGDLRQAWGWGCGVGGWGRAGLTDRGVL